MKSEYCWHLAAYMLFGVLTKFSMSLHVIVLLDWLKDVTSQKSQSKCCVM